MRFNRQVSSRSYKSDNRNRYIENVGSNPTLATNHNARIGQLEESTSLSLVQCPFESDCGYNKSKEWFTNQSQYCHVGEFTPQPLSSITSTTKQIIDSVTLRDDGMLEVITRFPSSYMLMSNPPQKPADRVLKQVYGVDPGCQIALVDEIEGRWVPPQSIEGHYEFS